MEGPGSMRGPVRITPFRLRGRPAGESDQPGGPWGPDAEEPHNLAAGQRSAVPAQFGHEFDVGALTMPDAVA